MSPNDELQKLIVDRTLLGVLLFFTASLLAFFTGDKE